MTDIHQFIIIRNNCETFVAWAETKQAALTEFREHGYSDAWRVLKKRTMKQRDMSDPGELAFSSTGA